MPLAIPTLIPSPSPVVMAFAMAALISVLFLLYATQGPIPRRRIIAAFIVAFAFVGWWGVQIFAATVTPEACAVALDTPIDNCRICKDLTPDSWWWYFYGCFAGC